MNPTGAVVIGLGLVLILVGIKGTQHRVVAGLKGAKPSTLAHG